MPKRVCTQFEKDRDLWSKRSTLSLKVWHSRIGETIAQFRADARAGSCPAWVKANLRNAAKDMIMLQKRIMAVVDARGGAEHQPDMTRSTK